MYIRKRTSHAVGSLILLTGLITAAVSAIAGCGNAAATPKVVHHAPKTTTVNGTLTLNVGDAENIDGSTCTGMGGYDDITAGAEVKITNGNGRTVAVGQLDRGQVFTVNGGSDMDHCTFNWSVTGVPMASKFYEVHVAGRGGPTFTKTQIQQPNVSLTLGQ